MKKIEILKKALVEEAPMNHMVKQYSTFEEYRDITLDYCGKRETRPIDGESVDFYDPELIMEEVNVFIEPFRIQMTP